MDGRMATYKRAQVQLPWVTGMRRASCGNVVHSNSKGVQLHEIEKV